MVPAADHAAINDYNQTDKDSRWLAVLCVLGFAADVVLVGAVARDWFPSLDGRAAVAVSGMLALSTMAAAVLVVHQIIVSQEKAFEESEQAGWEIMKRAAGEAAQRDRLQDTVQAYVSYLEQVGDGNLIARLPLEKVELDSDDGPSIASSAISCPARDTSAVR